MSLSGKTIVAAESAGAKVGSSITTNTSILVAGLGAGAEEEDDAKAKGVEIRTEDQFVAAVGGGKGKKAGGGSDGDEGPKLPRSAYALFCNEERPQLAKGLNVAEQAKELSARWKGLGEDGKAAVAKRLEEMKASAAAAVAGGGGGGGGT